MFFLRNPNDDRNKQNNDMKKIFTLLTLALACVMQLSAQKLQITNGGEVICCSQTETRNPPFTKYSFTNAIPFGKDKVSLGSREEPTITNISDQNITVEGIITINTADIFSWCGFDGFCDYLSPNKDITKKITLAPGESKTLDLHVEPIKGAYGTYTASIRFWVNDSEEVAWVILQYIYTEDSGINDVKAEGQSISVQNNTLSYSFSAAAARTINVYSIDGKLAKSLHTNSQQGQLSLSGLQQGVYLYAISQGGQQVATGKALVK